MVVIRKARKVKEKVTDSSLDIAEVGFIGTEDGSCQKFAEVLSLLV